MMKMYEFLKKMKKLNSIDILKMRWNSNFGRKFWRFIAGNP